MFVKIYFPERRLILSEAAIDRNDKMFGNHCNHRSRSEESGSRLLFQQIEFYGMSGRTIIVVM